jgi:hypothetical protein
MGLSFLNCCWSSPAQSFSGPSPAGLMTTFYCLKFEIPPTWRARSPYLYTPGTGWPSYTSRHWVPLSSSPTTRRATVELFHSASTRNNVAADPKKTPSLNNSSTVGRSRGNVFTEQLPSKERLLWLHYSGLQASCHNII